MIIRVIDPMEKDSGNIGVLTSLGPTSVIDSTHMKIRTQAWLDSRKAKEHERPGYLCSEYQTQQSISMGLNVMQYSLASISVRSRSIFGSHTALIKMLMHAILTPSSTQFYRGQASLIN